MKLLSSEQLQDMEFRHYSNEPFVLDRMHRYEECHPFSHFFNAQPDGLWLADNDEWAWYCVLIRGHKHKLQYVARVNLKPTARIAVLRSGRVTNPHHLSKFQQYNRVRRAEMRLNHTWRILRYMGCHGVYNPRPSVEGVYAHWDVSSACIWNLEAVESVEYLPSRSEEYQMWEHEHRRWTEEAQQDTDTLSRSLRWSELRQAKNFS